MSEPKTCCFCLRLCDEKPVKAIVWGSPLSYHDDCWKELQECLDRTHQKLKALRLDLDEGQA